MGSQDEKACGKHVAWMNTAEKEEGGTFLSMLIMLLIPVLYVASMLPVKFLWAESERGHMRGSNFMVLSAWWKKTFLIKNVYISQIGCTCIPCLIPGLVPDPY